MNLDAIRADYTATDLTVAEIAAKHGLRGGPQISKLARDHSWPRRWFTGGRLPARSPLRAGPRITSAKMLSARAAE